MKEIIWTDLRMNFITCCKSLAGDAVRMKLEMYTFTNVAIKNWQSKRSIMPPCPGIMSPKSCKRKIRDLNSGSRNFDRIKTHFDFESTFEARRKESTERSND